MSERMRVAALTAPNSPLEIQTRPVPTPDPGQALIRVRAAGVCHTDLHLSAGVPTSPAFPLVLGHEIAGEVVSSAAFAVGARVLVYYYDGCGDCGWCAQGLENLCRQANAKWGFDTDGGFAEYLVVPNRCLVAVPASVPLDEAAVLGCSGTTGVHVVDTVAQVQPGETVTVIGVGLACVQVAAARGARVIAVDPHEDSRAVAESLGAHDTVDPFTVDAVEAVRALVGGDGVDVVVDTVGNDRTPAQAIDMVRMQGRVVLVGYTDAPARIDVATAVTREVRLFGSVGATLADTAEVLRLAEAGLLRIPIADRYSLSQVNEALDRVHSGKVAGRLVLRP